VIAVITNVELDHHTEFRSLAELEAEFARWTASAAHVVRDAPPFAGELAVPGRHNRLNAGTALAALELTAVPAAEAAPVLARFSGTGRRFDVVEVGDVTIVDDYGHHPTEVAATLDAARALYPGRRLRVLFQPHLYSRTRHLAGELAGALQGADDIAVTDVYAAREQPLPGVSGKLLVDALSDRGRLVAWLPSVEEASGYLAGRAEPGDVLLTIGAGDVDRAPAILRERLRS
jgi:UDP-N-acetylmuramate--alanine ligase